MLNRRKISGMIILSQAFYHSTYCLMIYFASVFLILWRNLPHALSLPFPDERTQRHPAPEGSLRPIPSDHPEPLVHPVSDGRGLHLRDFLLYR